MFLVALATSACSPSGDTGFTLLFLGRSPAARLGGVSWAPDAPRSRLIAFDGDLNVVKTITDPRISSPAAIAVYPGSRLLITERTGEGVVFDTAGKPVREWESPFPASVYATNESRIVAARSPYFVQFVAEDGSLPLLWELDTLGHTWYGIGITHIPDIRYLAQLVNAGAVALSGEHVYYAPLVRDEILRLDAAGSVVWRSSRGLIRAEHDPEFMLGKERRVAHALVNIAMTVGPDGRLYVLGGADSAARSLRLDVLNAETGEVISSQDLGTPTTAIAVNRRGQIHVLDQAALLAQTPTLGRLLFEPAFALPDLSGKPVRLADYRGKVTLVNFWASWCDPCREEFPHMAELYTEFGARGFAIAAISDDVSDTRMRAFVREFRPPFPILVGRGRMKAAYHYRGLPYSVLLDRNGRIIERIFGFGGETEFSHLRDLISTELATP
ncbi:MAG TPA: TlpA disulfide reductase family protein [Gemmatimonadales bacterium]|nr:TlpA disulfide reductase family protein [Gemmatimonadales bacterium]